MTIQELRNDFKRYINALSRRDALISFMIVALGFASFFLGRLSVLEERKEGSLSITNALPFPDLMNQEGVTASAKPVFRKENTATGEVVVSRQGKVYHFPNCSGAKRIKEENQIWFQTEEEAKTAGYALASNCPASLR